MVKVALKLVVSFIEYVKEIAFLGEISFVQNVNFNGKAGFFIEAKLLYFSLFFLLVCLTSVLYRVIKKEYNNFKNSLL